MKLYFFLASLVIWSASVIHADVCLMVYQMAGTLNASFMVQGHINLHRRDSESSCLSPSSLTAFLLFMVTLCLLAADNDLEWFIRNDNYELITSPAVKDPSLTTWVYFDGRNFGPEELESGYHEDGWPVITEPLPEVYNVDGTAIMGEKEQGSRYLTFNHNLGKMIVVQTFENELSGDEPETVANFVATAVSDCVAKGSTEYFLIFSSHGTG